MFKLLNRLKNTQGFTLIEVSFSAAAMTSLLTIFALIPGYKMGLERVTLKQQSSSIIKEVVSQIESNRIDSAAPTFTVKGNASTITVPVAGYNTGEIEVVGRKGNSKFKLNVSSNFMDVTDSDNDTIRDEVVNDLSDTGKITIKVSWNEIFQNKSQPKYLEEEVVVYNTAIF